MTKRIKKGLVALSTAVALVVTPMAASAQSTGNFFEANDNDLGATTMADIFFARPLGLVGSALGFTFFIVSLPFSITSNSGAEAADQLVTQPLRYTFERPLGVEPKNWVGVQQPTGY
jgi:hypothetical protein